MKRREAEFQMGLSLANQLLDRLTTAADKTMISDLSEVLHRASVDLCKPFKFDDAAPDASEQEEPESQEQRERRQERASWAGKDRGRPNDD